MPRRRRVEPEILETAIRLFGTYGFHGVTTRDLATDAKVMEGSIYTWFKSKSALYQKAVTAVVRELDQQFQRFILAVFKNPSRELDLKRLHEALCSWSGSISKPAARMLVQVLVSDDKMMKTVRESLDNLTNIIADALDRQKTTSRKFDSKAAARTLVRAVIWARIDNHSEAAAQQDISETLQQWLLAFEALSA